MRSEQTSKRPRFTLRGILVVVTFVASMLGGCLALMRYGEGQDTVVTFDCGQGRQIVITVARSWEISVPVYYLVTVDGEVVVPTTFIDAIDPDADLQAAELILVSSAGSSLFGVSYRDEPEAYLAIHDFETGHSYPRGEHFVWNPDLDHIANRNLRNADRAAMESKLTSTCRESAAGR